MRQSTRNTVLGKHIEWRDSRDSTGISLLTNLVVKYNLCVSYTNLEKNSPGS